MPYSKSATKWKTVPSPTAGSMMRVRIGRPPHRETTAYSSPTPYRLKATRNQNKGIKLREIISPEPPASACNPLLEALSFGL